MKLYDHPVPTAGRPAMTFVAASGRAPEPSTPGPAAGPQAR